jgi:hypothetical protein
MEVDAMAWLKVEAETPEKPELLHVQDVCGCGEGDAFLAWFRLWRWFDAMTADGCVPDATKTVCDRVARLPGISAALETVGWLEFQPEGGVQVLGWDKHNGNSAKKRLEDAMRKRRTRSKTG